MNRFFISLTVAGLMIMQAHAQQTIVLQPGEEGKDAMLWTIHPDNNYGHTPKFYTMAWTYYGEPGTERSIIDFELSLIPEGALIEKALLDLYFFTDEPTYVPHSGDNSAYIRSITSYWREEEVTWNNQPAITHENQLYLPPSIYPEQDYTNLDVTALIIQQFENPEEYFGLMIQLETEMYYRSLMFASSDNLDSTLWPKLVVTYCFPPACQFEYEMAEDKVIFQDNSISANSWWWDFGDGFFSNLQDPEHYYDHYGTYYVCLTVEDGCGTDTWCDSVQFCMVPDAIFTYSMDGRKVEFQDSSMLADDFLWSFGNGFYSDLPAPVYTFEEDGVYEVCLTVSNSCDQSTFCDTLVVESSGLGDENLPLYSIYPNPASDRVNIQVPSRGDYLISLFHSLGKEILKETRTAGPGELLTLDVSRLSPGIYLLVMEYGRERFSTKLIIRR